MPFVSLAVRSSTVTLTPIWAGFRAAARPLGLDPMKFAVCIPDAISRSIQTIEGNLSSSLWRRRALEAVGISLGRACRSSRCCSQKVDGVDSESRYSLGYGDSGCCLCIQGLREPPGSCKLLNRLTLGLWHRRRYRFGAIFSPLSLLLGQVFCEFWACRVARRTHLLFVRARPPGAGGRQRTGNDIPGATSFTRLRALPAIDSEVIQIHGWRAG